MAIIESLKSGLELLEFIAESRKMLSTNELIEACKPGPLPPGTYSKAPEMSEASVRNSLETMVAINWLTEQTGPRGAKLYGLGEHAAKLWPIFLGRKLALIEEIQTQTAAQIEQTKRMLEGM